MKKMLTTLFIVFSNIAVSGISEFNNAVKVGDYVNAAKQTSAIWKDYDKSSEAAALIAREFAFVNLMAGRDKDAKKFVDEVRNNKNISEKDTQPAVTTVLSSLIEFKIDSDKETTKNLEDALRNRLELTGLDNITVYAVEHLYITSWQAGKWRNVRDQTEIAMDYFSKNGEVVRPRYLSAKVLNAASSYLSGDYRSYDKMVDAHNEIVEDINATARSNDQDELVKLKWLSEAWSLAIEAAYSSYYSQTGTNIKRDIKPRDLAKIKTPMFQRKNIENGLPYCNVELDHGGLRYPSSASFRGAIGAVIVKLDFDVDGKVKDRELLASVPSQYFSDSVMSHDFELKKSDEESSECRMDLENYIFSVKFLIQ